VDIDATGCCGSTSMSETPLCSCIDAATSNPEQRDACAGALHRLRGGRPVLIQLTDAAGAHPSQAMELVAPQRARFELLGMHDTADRPGFLFVGPVDLSDRERFVQAG
jgi:hypothetical protein